MGGARQAAGPGGETRCRFDWFGERKKEIALPWRKKGGWFLIFYDLKEYNEDRTDASFIPAAGMEIIFGRQR
jgi:hypothetical protein